MLMQRALFSIIAAGRTTARHLTRLAGNIADRLTRRADLRRAELRARAYAAIASDRLNRGGAA